MHEFRDSGMLRLTDFYKCYRALVRGKVESMQAKSENAADSEQHAKRARRYFHLALRYATSGSEPLVLVVMGGIATGKTTIAKQLARELDWPFFSSDDIRKTLAGVPLTIRTPLGLRDKVYSNQMTEQTYQTLLVKGLAAVAVHSGVVLDATFSSQTKRSWLRGECARAGVRLQFIELQADRNEIGKRLKARDESAAELSDARLEDLEKLSAAYQPPNEIPSLIRVNNSDQLSNSVSAVLLQLADKQSSR
jgi:predicted kinase